MKRRRVCYEPKRTFGTAQDAVGRVHKLFYIPGSLHVGVLSQFRRLCPNLKFALSLNEKNDNSNDEDSKNRIMNLDRNDQSPSHHSRLGWLPLSI
jgi:hypothetical protein